MKGDFSRNTFKKEKHYSKVNIQQGRVQVDADCNEQVDIIQYFERMSLVDVIGQTGAPEDNAGFEIKPNADGSTYEIGGGRFYVDGIMIENGRLIESPTEQPDLPQNNDGTSLAIPTEDGTYIAYLDVWERHITKLDDAEITESALDGPDTATRNKIIWQVKLLPVTSSPIESIDCKTALSEWESLILPANGTLKARTRPEITADDPCTIPPGSGYRRLENQLYRIEVHKAGQADGGATFKWQRDNGTIVVKATDFDEKTITVTDIGKDNNLLGFNAQQWVEVIDDRHELLNLPGTLAQVTVISETELRIVDGTVKGDTLTNLNFPREFNPKVRRWDSVGGDMLITIPALNEGFIEIEDGVEVQFESELEYHTGDYWLIPARVLMGDVEWRKDGSGNPYASVPEGIKHHYARLAILDFIRSPDGDLFTLKEDCRLIFPPLTRLKVLETPVTPPPISANVVTNIHGNAVWAENPTRFEMEKEGKGARFTLNPLSPFSNSFHFPLSTSIVSNSPPELTKVQILCIEDGTIDDVTIYDGPKLIYTLIRSAATIEPSSPAPSEPVLFTWNIPGQDPPLKIQYGLGVSVNVTFTFGGVGNPVNSIFFSSVGVEFKFT